MELKTYFSLARPGQSGDLAEIPGPTIHLQAGLQRGSPKDTGCPAPTMSPAYGESFGNGEHGHVPQGRQNTKSISRVGHPDPAAFTSPPTQGIWSVGFFFFFNRKKGKEVRGNILHANGLLPEEPIKM